MKRGDLVLVKYPFTDLSSEKLRPAFVIIPEDEEGDLLLAFITSIAIKKNSFDILISKNGTGLHKDSILRLKNIMTIHKSLIVGKIGSVSKEQLKIIEENLSKMLGLK